MKSAEIDDSEMVAELEAADPCLPSFGVSLLRGGISRAFA
jgi:hypothetical protein